VTRQRARTLRCITTCILTAWLAAACVTRESNTGSATPAHGVPATLPSTDSATLRADSTRRARNASLEPGELATVRVEPVTGWAGPGGLPFSVTVRTVTPQTALFRRFGTIALRTSLRERTPDLGQYPCASCHLGRGTTLNDKRIGDAHQNITAVHPVQTGGICSTCHAAGNVELLSLKNGERVSLDHTYRLCAQCHFQQTERWAGGAHGKRLDGWQGRRVVMGCADCHDPHRPALESRIPFRAPRIERIRGNTK
jgi:hypothetical protein